MYGMAWAMQEFGYIAFFEGISTCVYIPMCLYAKYGTCPSCVVRCYTLHYALYIALADANDRRSRWILTACRCHVCCVRCALCSVLLYDGE
jgi:hypothetical protein